jgi:hypothetical protein
MYRSKQKEIPAERHSKIKEKNYQEIRRNRKETRKRGRESNGRDNGRGARK